MPDPPPAEARRSPQMAVIGQFTRSEYASLLERAAVLLRPEQIRAAGSLAWLLADHLQAEAAHHVDLIVVLQTWPEEYTHNQIYDLLDRYPFARLLVCFGPWGDSDGRTRDLWPPATRVPLAQAEARLRHELAVLHGVAEPLPLTASRDECFACDYAAPNEVPRSNLSITVQSPDPAIRDWMSDLFRSQSCTVNFELHADADVMVWDVDPWRPQTTEQLVTYRQTHPVLPIIAIAGFARAHEVAQMQECGVDAVVAKTSSSRELSSVVESMSPAPWRRSAMMK